MEVFLEPESSSMCPILVQITNENEQSNPAVLPNNDITQVLNGHEGSINIQEINTNTSIMSVTENVRNIEPLSAQSLSPVSDDEPKVQENLSQQSESKIPAQSDLALSPFKRHLFYPQPIQNIKKNQPKERAPSAISSMKWREFMKKDKLKADELDKKRKRCANREDQKTTNKRKEEKKNGNENTDIDETSCTPESVSMKEKPTPKVWKFGKTFPHVRPVGKNEEVKIDEWMLVSFEESGHNSRRFFIGKVIGVNNDGFDGSFLRPKTTREQSGYVYGFPDIIDEYPFTKKDIVGRLENPEIYGRGLYRFHISHKDIQSTICFA